MSRALACVLVIAATACGDDGASLPVDSGQRIDAAIDARMVDARPIDAPTVDAPTPIDAPAGAITTACTNVCAAIGVCFMEPPDATCVAECSADLADCSAQQVQDVDACKTQACGDIESKTSSPLFTCLTAITCIDM